MHTFHLKADIKIKAESIGHAKAQLSDIFQDFELDKKVHDYEGQISLEPEGGLPAGS